MTYESYEQSIALGEPVELYDVYDAEGTHYRWNTTSVAVTYNGFIYEPEVVDRTELVLGERGEANALDVKLSRSNTFTNRFIQAPVEGEVILTVYRQHAGFTVTLWQGLLLSVVFDENGVPTCRFEPRSSADIGLGDRRRCQRLCDHALYGYRCGANQESFRVDGTLTNVSGLVLTSAIFSTKSDGWFIGGEIIIGIARRLIKAHSTNTVTIARSMLDAVVGASFRAYAGCDHTPTTCDTKFNKKLNYGGHEHLSVTNPFETNITY